MDKKVKAETRKHLEKRRKSLQSVLHKKEKNTVKKTLIN